MIKVCALSELDERKPFAADADGTPVVVVRDGERVHALHDLCSHAAVSLSEGEVTKQGIECWLHGSRFDLTTGEPSSPPASEPVDVYSVEVRDGDVYVAVPQT